VSTRRHTTIRPEDRLFHLILALLATSQGISKDMILHSVRGYREDSEAGVSKETLERRFERDKDILRDMGIPLETWIPSDDDGNNRSTVYRIPKGKFDHPSSVDLDAQDIRLLNIAAAVWREGSLSADARVAQVKLASHGVAVDEPLVGALPMITARDPALAALRMALAEQKQVAFDYLKPGDQTPSRRQVSPLAVVLHEGNWHLLSVDEPDGSERTFLLRRIVSSVDILDDSARDHPGGRIQAMTRELDELWESQVATLSVVPDSQAATILAHRPGTTVDGATYSVHYTDVDVLAETLCEHGPEVTVIDPPELVDRIIALLTTVRTRHGG